MKNSLFLLGAAAVVALSSCTKNEVLEVAENRAIGFGNAFVGSPVRAINDVADLQGVGFNVFGSFSTDQTYKGVFDNVAVTYSDSKWQSDKTEYWQNGKSYVFQAYSGTATATPTEHGVEFTGYTASGDEDLLSANLVNKDGVDVTNPGTVDFTFRHVLSQVKFTFTNGFNGNVKLAISNVKINGLATTGNYTLSAENTGTWGTLSGTSEYAPTITPTDPFGASATAVTAPKIVLPQNVKDKTVTFDLVVSGSLDFKSQTITVELPDYPMAEGNVYNFTTELNAENIKDPENPDQTLKPIEFTASVSEWSPEKSDGSGSVQ